MLSLRSRVAVLLSTFLVLVAGCGRSAGVKLDPWQEYLIAQEVWKNERDMLEEYEKSHQINPTDNDKAVIERLRARFDKASAHVKAVRERLPEN